jgi:uncharacterized protein YndB with AHSA1/START domain
MTPKVERTGGLLIVTATFNASRERVFAAWTNADQVQAWWGCGQATSVVSTVELRVGGKYCHVMQVGDCECVIDGVFTEVDAPRRLAFWAKGQSIEGHPPSPDTTTVVEFSESGGRTDVRLTVSGLAETPFEDLVADGWRAGLEKLATIFP